MNNYYMNYDKHCELILIDVGMIYTSKTWGKVLNFIQ